MSLDNAALNRVATEKLRLESPTVEEINSLVGAVCVLARVCVFVHEFFCGWVYVCGCVGVWRE